MGHAQLEAAISEVNAILEDLIKKLAAQESEWQNMLAKLLAGLEAKVTYIYIHVRTNIYTAAQ